MLKRKIEAYLENWKNNRSTALLIKGARQVGKTYSIEKFIKDNFKHVIEINFAERTDLIDSFAQIKNYEQFIVRLSAVDGRNLISKETIIFFDEIQILYERRADLKKNGLLDYSCQDLLTVLKPLVKEGDFRYILSGSLLGVTLNDVVLNPTGYLDVKQMYPLDFEEFLWAKGVGDTAISYVNKCFLNKEVVDNEINKLFLNYFREYVLIGGLPEALEIYLNTRNIYLVQESQYQISNQYTSDINKYVEDESRRLRIREIYQAIPSELNTKNKRFIFSHALTKKELQSNKMMDDFLWLTNAGIAIPVYNITDAVLPLAATASRKTFKLFLNDIGLLDSMLLNTGIREKLLNEEQVINYGAPYENVCAQELIAHGFYEKIYYYNSKKNGEVDFIIEYNNEVLPIEIKSGKPNELNIYDHTALNNLIRNHPIKEAYVFGESNVKRENDKTINFPIYMISFINFNK